MPATIELNAPVFVTSAEFAKMLSVSKVSLLRKLHDGRIPKPVYADKRGFLWSLADIQEWLCDGAPDLKTGGMTNAAEDAPCTEDIDEVPWPMRELLIEAQDLANLAEQLLASTDTFIKRLKLEAMLLKREVALWRNERTHDGTHES